MVHLIGLFELSNPVIQADYKIKIYNAINKSDDLSLMPFSTKLVQHPPYYHLSESHFPPDNLWHISAIKA